MSGITPRKAYLLEQACAPIAAAVAGSTGGIYQVGTSIGGKDFRDVDVRLILEDDTYDLLAMTLGQHFIWVLGLIGGEYLESRTGLPIDFQVQRRTEANELHAGPRSALGMGTIDSTLKGDGGR